VYAGIHYTYSCVAAREMGNKIGQNILNKLHFKKDDDDDDDHDHDRHNDHDKD